MSITKDQIAGVKGRGFLLNRETECFFGRVVTVGGLFTPDELHTIAECAEKFGSGKVIFTSRLAAEIVGIPFEKIPEAEHNLHFGGTGAKVRPITAAGVPPAFTAISTLRLWPRSSMINSTSAWRT